MVLQGLAPGMEDGGHAELGAEMLGVGRDGGECLGRAAEQDGIDDGFVLEGNLSGGRRQGEDDVEIPREGVRLADWRAIARVPSPGTSGNADYDRSYGESGEVVKWSTVVR